MAFLGIDAAAVSPPSTDGRSAVSQARFQKQQREKARRERAAAKWAKKAERANAEAPEPTEPARDEADVLAELATLHARFEAGELSFEDFEVTRQQVTDQLDVR
jgi:hypothetical protein